MARHRRHDLQHPPAQQPSRSSRPRPKPKRRFPAEVLTDAEVRALMGACGTGTWTAVRHRALLALLYRTGLRINEAIHLRPKDLDLKAGAIRVLFAKGGKDRTVGIDPGGAAVLREWLARREVLSPSPLAPLFCSASGKPLTAACVRRLLPALARQAGLQKRVHAHGLRHTHAAQLREEGVDIGLISKQLGHQDISTTARYLDHIAPRAVVEAMGRREWRSALTTAHPLPPRSTRRSPSTTPRTRPPQTPCRPCTE